MAHRVRQRPALVCEKAGRQFFFGQLRAHASADDQPKLLVEGDQLPIEGAVVQAIERSARQAARKTDQPRGAELQHRPGPLRRRFLEQQLGVEPVAGQRPGKSPWPVHGAHVQRASVAGAAEERRTVARSDRPPRAFGEPAAIGLHGRDPGPPVGQMVGLGEEAPDVLARREQLPRCLHPHQRDCRPLRTAGTVQRTVS